MDTDRSNETASPADDLCLLLATRYVPEQWTNQPHLVERFDRMFGDGLIATTVWGAQPSMEAQALLARVLSRGFLPGIEDFAGLLAAHGKTCSLYITGAAPATSLPKGFLALAGAWFDATSSDPCAVRDACL